MRKITLRKKAKQFGKLVRHSAMTKRTGVAHKPISAKSSELGITFIGHSSFLVQLGGKNVVIDPNYAPWIFVLKRLRRAGVRIADLPCVDLILVSHAHFDHLHRPSLRAIARSNFRKFGKRPTIVVPRNVGDLVADLGVDRVIEMDWWQSAKFGALEITHTPSRHWGARIIRDMHRGYGGFVLKAGQHSVYHSGDTAYFDGFREIGRRLHPKIALLPIGAYQPESFRNVHTSPEDAVQAFIDLKAHCMIPMHYGTFRLSHEPMEEPIDRLLADAEAKAILRQVLILEEGKTKIFGKEAKE
ncbi:MAG TPA: MBL fold metallo-hydrolase [Candidatus Koribacter sp.]|jgi:L-ascorbate metabolism protein UlaG (beta-lactamase superfamily)